MKRNISVATLVSTYRTSNQKRIVDGRYTATVLFICSLIFWGAGALFDTDSVVRYVPMWASQWLVEGNVYILRIVSLFFSFLSAFLVSSYVILERRVAWQLSMLLLVASLIYNVQPDASVFSSMLLPVVAIGLFFRCENSGNAVHESFVLFVIATIFTLFFSQFIIFLPLLLFYPAFEGRFSVKSFFASLLGIVTPLWVTFALIYLFPSLSPLVDSTKESLIALWNMSRIELSLAMLMMLIAEFVVALPAIIHFFVTASIGRAHLRRRMLFCIVTYVLLWFAGWLCPEHLILFLVWRLPIYSLLSAYVFSVLPPKVSNIYIISSLFLWVASMVIEIWIG